jgi:hypothetical protein
MARKSQWRAPESNVPRRSLLYRYAQSVSDASHGALVM